MGVGVGVPAVDGNGFSHYTYPNGSSRPSVSELDKLEEANEIERKLSEERIQKVQEAAAREYEEKVTFEHNAYAVARAKETERGVEKVNDEKIYREQRFADMNSFFEVQERYRKSQVQNSYCYGNGAQPYGGYAGYGASGQYSRARVAPSQSYGELARSGVSCMMDCEMATKGYYAPADYN